MKKLKKKRQMTDETGAYITVGDHKEQYPHRLSFHLINPTKISKNLLDIINKILIINTNVNRWKNTTVVNWFENKPNKKQCSFIQSDMENFYTSISLSLFDEAIQYASRNIKKSHIFKTTNPEKKKNSVGPDFHIPMASNVETEV